MKHIEKKYLYNTMSCNNTPSGAVEHGEIFTVDTEMNGGDWLKSIDDHWYPGINKKGPNLCTVIRVNNAHPGDTLAVRIIKIEPSGLGYTGFAGWRTELPGLIYPEAKNWDTVTHTVRIENNEILWSDNLKLPVIPMIGTIGTAPEGEATLNNYAYHHGGNMDVQEICEGATVYLIVNVEGALLHVGDVHAIMGDGEIPYGGGIECAATLTMEVRVIRGYKAKNWLRLENDEYIMTIANEIRIKDSFCAATHELIDWMVDDYGFSPEEAYLLLGQVLEARCTMLHGDDKPFSPYITKIKKKYLKADTNLDLRGRNIR